MRREEVDDVPAVVVEEARVALRPAIVNWRTREEDVDLLVDVIRELGGRIA